MFQMAPLVHAGLLTCDDGFAANPIVLVISPLLNLVEDQNNFLLAQGISAGKLNGWWRGMLSSGIYKKNLIEIIVDEAHCISHW